MSKSKSNEIIVIGKMDHTLDNTLESANRVYSKDGICPTIPTCAGGNIQPKIIDELKTIVAMRGRNTENPSDRTAVAKTEQRLEPKYINLYDEQGKETSFQDRVYKTDKISPAITTSFRPNYAVEYNDTDSEKIKIKQATKQGYIECKAGGVADFSYPESKLRRGRVQGGGDVSPTLTSSNLGVCKVESRYRIRKLTPKECWRLMGFSDEDFEKAKYEKKKIYVEGGDKCNVKLRAVQESQRLEDTETYVLCTTKELQDMEILKIVKRLSAEMQEQEKMQNVNFAIEKSDASEHWGCATNIIKCIDCMGIHFTLTEEKDLYRTVIIGQVKKGSSNTEKYMRIITESNLNPLKLYIILILTGKIMQSKIYGSTTLQVNINGNIAITDDYEEKILLKISNLKMDIINERMSNSALYKQAGNSIVKDVLMAIFRQLI